MASHRILIVEDQPEVRRMLHVALEPLASDASVVDLPSGEEALLVLARQTIDLAVIDVRLAGISGLDLLQKARQRQPELKVILITGLVDPQTRQRVAEAGAEAYFFKPIAMPAFLEAARRCLEAAQPDGRAPQESRLPDPPGDAAASDPTAGTGRPPVQAALGALEDAPIPDLAGLLAGYRQKLGAQALLVLDSGGQALASAGALPGGFEAAGLLPAATAALNAASGLVQDPASGLLCCLGEPFDLYLAQAGRQAFLVAVDAGAGRPLRATALSEVPPAAAGLAGCIPACAGDSFPAGQPGPGASAATASGSAEGLADLTDLFGPASNPPLAQDELNSFWADAATHDGSAGPQDSGMLSYEQARKLGLAPDG